MTHEHLSNEKRTTGCLGYIGNDELTSYVWITIRIDKPCSSFCLRLRPKFCFLHISA